MLVFVIGAAQNYITHTHKKREKKFGNFYPKDQLITWVGIKLNAYIMNILQE